MNQHLHPQATKILFPAQPALSQYITAGSLPDWDRLPLGCKRELVLTLANLLLELPEIQALHQPGAAAAEAPNEPQF